MANPQQMKLIRQVQKMQADMEAAQKALAEEELEVTAGGGTVTVTITGSGDLRGIRIDPSVVDPDDVETLEDLVVAAVTEAQRVANARQQEKLGPVGGGLDVGALGGLGNLFG